jgi:sulfite reductase alpha subunit-like flavoprotein
MVTVLSNVLRKNSAQDHRDLARAIHGMLLHDHPVQPPAPGELPRSATYGEGFIGYAAERQAVQLKFETQEALLGLGYDIGDIDGIIGANTRKAIKDFQQTQGLKADGKPSEKLVQQMRKVAQEKGLIRADSIQ